MIPVARVRGALDFVVDGAPEPQRRPRFVRMGKSVRTYPSQADVIYRQTVQTAWREAGAVSLGDAPVSMSIWACFARPQSHWLKSGELSREGRRTSHPMSCDIDNVAKAILDALNGLAWTDDRQVCGLVLSKFYQFTREQPPFVQVHAQAIRNFREGG